MGMVIARQMEHAEVLSPIGMEMSARVGRSARLTERLGHACLTVLARSTVDLGPTSAQAVKPHQLVMMVAIAARRTLSAWSQGVERKSSALDALTSSQHQ